MKQTVYKLTDQDGYTRKGGGNQCKWGPNVTHTAKGKGGLCSDGVIHAYASPLLAVLMNPIHCNFSKPMLWKAECEVSHNDGTKLGGKSLTTIETLRLPEVTTRQRTIFAILCAEKALSITKYDHPKLAKWRRWVRDYKDGNAANAAAAADAACAAGAAGYAANAAAYAASYAATDAVSYAAYAAGAAAYAAGAAAYAAYSAASAAARAASYAASAASKINLVAIAEEAMKF